MRLALRMPERREPCRTGHAATPEGGFPGRSTGVDPSRSAGFVPFLTRTTSDPPPRVENPGDRFRRSPAATTPAHPDARRAECRRRSISRAIRKRSPPLRKPCGRPAAIGSTPSSPARRRAPTRRPIDPSPSVSASLRATRCTGLTRLRRAGIADAPCWGRMRCRRSTRSSACLSPSRRRTRACFVRSRADVAEVRGDIAGSSRSAWRKLPATGTVRAAEGRAGAHVARTAKGMASRRRVGATPAAIRFAALISGGAHGSVEPNSSWGLFMGPLHGASSWGLFMGPLHGASSWGLFMGPLHGASSMKIPRRVRPLADRRFPLRRPAARRRLREHPANALVATRRTGFGRPREKPGPTPPGEDRRSSTAFMAAQYRLFAGSIGHA